ncbi:MAG: hypothetical protein JXD23_02355 [Spirochaetales bacterium]|nr:hypothetical protein [Spirochaetales bacterium]
MTLATPRINEFAERFYLRFLRQDKLLADVCSDIYDRFIRQMRQYRRKHPEKVRVNASFVRRCEDWIVRKVLDQEKRRKSRWELECELAKTQALEHHDPDNYSSAFALLKLGNLFSRWIEKDPKAAPFLEIFLLYHAYYLNGRILNQFSRILPLRKSEFVRRVKKTKKMVAERFAVKVGKAMETSRLWYCRSLKAELRSKDAAPEKRARNEAMRKEFLRRQHRALERASSVKPYPKFTELAEICRLSERQVRYALRKCRAEIAAMCGE